ncbi:MAG: DNA polymerase III subunit beta [Buchnera aphidicola (Brevicoryne brassicae)]|uniref:Beta sliding clamp n=1 Tax=Buchnera aphidicola (Brevicoryne brassicae) TaxID=911343 RepID=A0AAJ5PUK8_9GAMM|nr:DNA polymerase III subunit beta [Buchnera aphidicola]QCI19600.1 DNA polymerase III subunit beta [Buchnera aphidicola (Brevicoryne brassicae)]WAI18971.1 MAG: DNA polymerase III subunit beta [Buchnera aphidicola (Brevicoryne brassicae)]
MKFNIKNNILTKHLQKINRLIVKNTSLPILENILIVIKEGILSLTATNIEIELICNIKILTEHKPGSVTVSGRKLLDICRNTSESSEIKIKIDANKMHIISNNSNYVLTILPSDDFPNHNNFQHVSEFFISSNILKKMIEKTQFAMGKQDVRYYLNGMLLEKNSTSLYTVATDGYRLGIAKDFLRGNIIPFSVIIPRKGIIELYKLLNIKPQLIHVLIGKNNIRIHIEELIFTAQLIEGQYPDYKSILLKKKNYPIILNHKLLKQSLLRVSILADKNFCGIEMHIKKNEFKVLSDNQEEEKAEDSFKINYCGDEIEISINVYYILDVLNTINSENIFLFLNESNNAIQIEAENENTSLYVIMLLRR